MSSRQAVVFRRLAPPGSRRRAAMSRPLPVRAYLLHLTHYDPSWCPRRAREPHFILRLALEGVGAAAAGYTTLEVDGEDPIRYRSLPSSRDRTHADPDLAALARRARAARPRLVPKLRFSRATGTATTTGSGRTTCGSTPRSTGGAPSGPSTSCSGRAGPGRYFHVGMDEGQERSTVHMSARSGRSGTGLRDGG